MAGTTVRIAPKRLLGLRLQVLQNQILALEQFLKNPVTGIKQLKGLGKYITDDNLYSAYSNMISYSFENIIVDSLFDIVKAQLKKCRQELADIVTQIEQYE